MTYFQSCLLALAVLSLSAPSAYSQASQPQIQLDSILRVNDSVVFSSAATSTIELQYSMACAGDSWQLLYVNRPARTYPSGYSFYSEPGSLPLADIDQFRTSPLLASACQSKPDLRVLSDKRTDGLEIFVDASTLTKGEGNLRQIWAGFDYPAIAFDPIYKAPYAQKRERLEFDCGRDTYRLLAGYNVDVTHTVTDGIRTSKSTFVTLTSNSEAAYRVVYQAVCGDLVAIESRPILAKRDKLMPVVSTSLLAVEPSVRDVIAALNLRTPFRTLRGFKTIGSKTYRGNSETMSQAITLATGQPNGVFEVGSKGDGYSARQLWFMGMILLANTTNFESTGSSNSGVATLLTLSGDWQAMAVGTTLGYRAKGVGTSSLIGVTRYELDMTCQITRELNAKDLHSQLLGLARQLQCNYAEDELKRVTTYFFLADYGFTFRQGDSPNDFYYSIEKISEVDF